MSAWTWTYVKSEFIPRDIVIKLCEDLIKEEESIWYYKSSRKNFKSTLKKWFEIYDEDYDYFVDELKIPKEQLTHEFLEQRLRNKIKILENYIQDLNLVKIGNITLDKCLRNNKVWDTGLCLDPNCVLIDEDLWVHLNQEIFRLREYSDMTIKTGLKTIKDLISYLSSPERQNNLIWWENDNLKTGLFPEFENRLREYYGQFGDGNFSVHFG